MDILSRANFSSMCKAGKIKDDDIVACTIIPTGAVCQIMLSDDTPVLRNGATKFVADDLSSELTNNGITGEVVLNINDLNYGTPRFLTYSIKYAKLSEWVSKLTVHVRRKSDTYTGRIKVSELKTRACKVSDLNDYILKLSSESDAFFGLEVTTSVGDTYFMKPERLYNGTVVAVKREEGNHTLVVKVEGDEQLSMVTRLTTRMKQEVLEHGEALIGSEIKLKAISRVPGVRLESFWQLTALFTINVKGISQ